MSSMTTIPAVIIQNDTTPDEDDISCKDTLIKDTMFYPITLIPAAVIILSFCFTQRRRRMLMGVMKKFPILIHPMDLLTKSDRISYMCALGATANLLFGCIFDNVRAISYDGPLVMQTVVLLASVLVFGVVYFPVFGCLTLGSLLGFGIGSLYVWMLLGVELIRMATCDTSSELYKVLLAIRGLPNIMCLFYLSLRIPYKFYQDYRCDQNILANLNEKKKVEYYTMNDLMTSNIGRHIRELLKKPKEEEVRDGFRAKFVGFVLDHTYRPHHSFRYSARFLSTLFLALLLLFAVVFQGYTIIYSLRKFLKDNVLPLMASDPEAEKSAKRLLRYIINTIIASVTFAALLGLYGLVRMFTQYRETMFALNRGQLKHLWKDRTNDYLLLSAMKYSGYQVIYVVWGFIVQTFVFLVICALIAGMIWAFRDGHTSWFTDRVVQYWPIPFWALIINVAQILMTKYSFIGHKRHLVLDNRHVLFIASYFIFFYNIFLGIFSSLLRIIKSIVIGAILLPRLDTCVLPQDFASMDPGYMTYVGFMKLENDHTHPVMLAFIRLLLILARDRRNPGANKPDDDGARGGQSRKPAMRWKKDKQEGSQRHRAAIFKWQTLYTLINNPDLRMDRKGYIQRIKLARELGLTIPKSDTYVSIGDDVLNEAKELLEQREGNVIGKIAGAAGDKFDDIKNRIQKKIRERSRVDSVEVDLGEGSRREKVINSNGLNGSNDDVVVHVGNGSGAVNKPRRENPREDVSNERNEARADVSYVFPGNKRRRRRDREVHSYDEDYNNGRSDLSPVRDDRQRLHRSENYEHDRNNEGGEDIRYQGRSRNRRQDYDDGGERRKKNVQENLSSIV